MHAVKSLGKFELVHNGFLIEICETIQDADDVIEYCPDDYVADFEGGESTAWGIPKGWEYCEVDNDVQK